MTEKDLSKIQFMKLLNLEATSENESSMVLEKNVYGLLNQYSSLSEKNANTKTGYENFCIKKGSTKLFPFKDFDFIGKNVVCQKCCQKFASKVSYKAHIGTDICVRTYNGPNLVYLNYKNRNGRRVRKKNKNKSIEDLIGHDIKKNLLNPEMLNTLQTRNNCYSDVVHQRNKVREKQKTKISSTKSDEPVVKKPRGRPRKIVEVSGEPKKRGRPKKFIPVIVDSVSETENSLNSNIESHETESNEPNMNGCSVDDAYNNNLNENEKQTALFSKIKMLTNKFWSIFSPSSQKKSDTYTVGYQHSVDNNCDPCINEKLSMPLSVTQEKKVLISTIGSLENDIKLLYEKLKKTEEYSVPEDLQSMLFKLMEKCKQYKLSMTDIINESTTNKEKQNIHCTVIQNVGGMEVSMNKMDIDTNENVEKWLNKDNKDTISPTISTISTDDYESGSGMSTDIISLEKEISNDSFEDNRHFTSISDWKSHHSEHSTLIIKDTSVRSSLIDSISSEEETYNNIISYEDDVDTSIEDVTPNYTNSVNNHLNNVDLNYNCNPMLKCKFCGRHFASIAEMKMHRSEHFTLVNKQNQFLCTICGIKFKMYKNYIKHVNLHRKKESKNKDYKNHSNKFKCKVCSKHFNFLRSYYVHIKNHRK